MSKLNEDKSATQSDAKPKIIIKLYCNDKEVKLKKRKESEKSVCGGCIFEHCSIEQKQMKLFGGYDTVCSLCCSVYVFGYKE